MLILRADQIVLNAWIAITGTTPGHTTFNSHVSIARSANGEANWINEVNSFVNANFGGADGTARLADAVIANLGLGAIAGIRETAIAFFNSQPANRGGLAIAAADWLRTTTPAADDTALISAQAAFRTASTGAFNYSSNPSNFLAADATPGAPIAVTGRTFLLTTGADQLTGTAGNDTFNADNSIAAAPVLSAADALNGGAGTDTLNVFSAGAAFNLPALTSIETLNVYDQNANQSIAAANFASVTTANLIRGDGAMTLTGGANLATVGVTDVVAAAGGVVLAFEAARTSATVNLNGVTAANAVDVTTENVDVNGAGLTTVTVNTSGTASSFDVLDVASATTIAINADANLTVTSLETAATAAALTITGAGSVNLGTLDSAINTVTATAATGALTAAIGSELDTVITLGSGNDVITASTGAIAAGNALAVNAGAGTGDVLVIGATAHVDSAAEAARYTNFEIIRTNDSHDMSLVAGITGLQVLAATNEAFTNLSAAQASAVTLMGNQGTNVTFGVTGATTVGQLDTLTLKIDDATAGAPSTIVVGNLTAAGVETVRIVATDNLTLSDATGLTALTRLEVSGAGTVGITTGTLVLNVNTVVDASAATGAFTFNASGATANGIAITGSATKANTITGTNQDDVITGGTGVDTVRNQANAATDSDSVNFVSDSSADIFEVISILGKTTIANFDVATTTTTEDLVNVSNDSVDGLEVQITASAAQALIGFDRTIVIEQTVGAAASLTTGGTATLATADFTAATLTNVAAFLSERFTGDNDAAADENALIILNNGTNSFMYAYADSTTANTTIDAGELTLIGVFTGAILNAGDVFQTV